MKALVFALLFVGCVPPHDQLAERYAMVETRDGFGCAVSIGGGRYLTAYHVLQDDSLMAIITANGKDTAPVFIDSMADVALLQTRFREQSYLFFADAEIGQEVYFIQTIHGDNLELYFMSARVTRKSKTSLYLDKIIIPGASGTAVMSSDGSLVGIMVAAKIFGNRQIIGSRAVRYNAFKKLVEGP